MRAMQGKAGVLAGVLERPRAYALVLRSPEHNLLRNSLFIMLNTFLGSAFGLLIWVAAARLYSPDQLGLGAAYISTLTFLAGLAELGLGTAIIRFGPGMRDGRSVFLNSALALVALAMLLATAVFALGTPLWSPRMGALTHSRLTLAVFIAAGVMTALDSLFDKIYIAFERAHFLVLTNLLTNALRLAATVALSFFLGATGFVLALCVGVAAALLLSGSRLAPRTVAGYQLKPALSLAAVRSRLGYTIGNHLGALAALLPAFCYPLLIVNLIGAAANATFYPIWMIANLLFVIPLSVATSAFARASNSEATAGEALAGATRRLLLVLIVPALGLVAVSPIAFRVLGLRGTRAEFLLLAWLVLSVFPYAVNTVAITFFRVTLNTRAVIVVSGVASAACLGLSLAGALRLGLAGIALGWLLGQLAGAAVAALLVYAQRRAQPAA
ncbi:MAG TPA: hypothetical protein VFI42_08645 [Thermomicrobiaceae bacterium]|nr:hypothetical protein [Thermomicrobiaceae bacterium]